MYIVEKTNGQILAEVADKTINTSACSLNLVGRGAKDYGDAFAENFVHLLENFANSTAPSRVLPGQMWYDTGTKVMKFWDGIAWHGVGGGVDTGLLAGAAGATGVALSNDLSVTVCLSNGKIVAVMSAVDVTVALLPATVTIGNISYALASRFPYGLQGGVTLATDELGYVFEGTATSALYADAATGTGGETGGGSGGGGLTFIHADGTSELLYGIGGGGGGLTDTGVVAGTYTLATITVDAQGRLTYAANGVDGGPGDCLSFTRAAGSIDAVGSATSLSFTRADGSVNTISDSTGLSFTYASGTQQTISGIDCGSGTGNGTGLSQSDADARYLRLTGGTVTGNAYVDGGVLVVGATSVPSLVPTDTKMLVKGRQTWVSDDNAVVMTAGALSGSFPQGAIGTSNGYPFKIWTNSVERLIVTENGDVGIGGAPSAGTPDGAQHPIKIFDVRGRIRSATAPVTSVGDTNTVAMDMIGAFNSLGNPVAGIGTATKHAINYYLNSGNHFRMTKLTTTGGEDLTLSNTGAPSLMIFGRPMPEDAQVGSGTNLSNYAAGTVVASITAWQLSPVASADPASATPSLDIGTHSVHPVRMRVGGYIAMAWNPSTFDTYAYGSNAYKPNGGSWTALSDQRLKTDIRSFTPGLDAITALTPRLFKYKNDVGMYTDARPAPENDFVGLVAQEANETPLAPWIVGTTKSVVEPETSEPVDVLTVDSTAITYALINAVKELSARVEALEAQLAELTTVSLEK